GAVAVRASDVHAGIAKPDQIAALVTRDVGDKPWMLIDVPALLRAHVVQHESWRLEAAVTIREGDPHARIPEAHEIAAADRREQPSKPMEVCGRARSRLDRRHLHYSVHSAVREVRSDAAGRVDKRRRSA